MRFTFNTPAITVSSITVSSVVRLYCFFYFFGIESYGSLSSSLLRLQPNFAVDILENSIDEPVQTNEWIIIIVSIGIGQDFPFRGLAHFFIVNGTHIQLTIRIVCTYLLVESIDFSVVIAFVDVLLVLRFVAQFAWMMCMLAPAAAAILVVLVKRGKIV